MIDERVRVCEQSPLLDAAGETLRPGGLALTGRALAFCALPAGARVLDVGCGQAASVEYLVSQGLSAIGLDPSALLLRAGRRRSTALALIRSAGEHLPFAGARFDAVLAECSLSLMRDSSRALAEFWRVLRPGGYLVLSDIYAREPGAVDALRCLPIDSCLCGAVAQTTVIARVEAGGFVVRLWEDHTGALKVFTARLIWSHGSALQFWCRTTSPSDASVFQAAVARARPGYYLLIARKE